MVVILIAMGGCFDRVTTKITKEYPKGIRKWRITLLELLSLRTSVIELEIKQGHY